MGRCSLSNLPLNTPHFCVICGFPAAVMKLAKTGKPFYSCASCRSMIFLNTQHGIDGLMWLMDRSHSWVKERASKHFEKAMETVPQPLPVIPQEVSGGTEQPARAGQPSTAE